MFRLVAALIVIAMNAAASELVLQYRQPASPEQWEEAVPLGNGRLGAMIAGGIDKDRVILNEDSLWSGWPEPHNDRKGAYDALIKIRKLLKAGGDQSQIKSLAMEDFCSLYGYGKPDFGAYQSFCNADFVFGHDVRAVTNYHRALDLETAIATVSYTVDGIRYTREAFCSYPDNVLVMRFIADKPGQVNFTLGASSLHTNIAISAAGSALVLTGQVETGNTEHPGMTFEGRWEIRAQGGRVSRNQRRDTLIVENSDAVTLIFAGATDYRLGYPSYKGAPPDQRNRETMATIRARTFEEMRSAHIKDYTELFNRMELHLGKRSRTDLTTQERLARYKQHQDDQALEALMFQYGRYLLIASSRPGCLPANLQGLWNNSNKPPWNGDYHLNINFQMNYWPVHLCNLSECAEPMIRWTEDLTLPGARTAKTHYNARGWVVHHSANVWGYTPPGPKRGIHMLEAESGAFLCQNIWDYYAFTLDTEYLKQTGWPILKGAAEFWMDNLQEVEGGFLAVSPSYSPEHGPLSDGAYYQTMIVWDLFSHCIQAADILDTDQAFAATLVNMRKRIQPPKIGQYGQLCEWRDPVLERNANKDKHRHVSHLYAVYPGKQIIPEQHDKLAAAAIQSMNFRGDAATGWSMGWKINLWARLLDGNRAHKLIKNFISGRVYANLWCAHPPFQIDGNFGYTAGVAEMLLQSHSDEIVLLPALPSAWETGCVRGLCARGGAVVDMVWDAGELVSATIHSRSGTRFSVRYKDRTQALELKQGQSIQLRGQEMTRSTSEQ